MTIPYYLNWERMLLVMFERQADLYVHVLVFLCNIFEIKRFDKCSFLYMKLLTFLQMLFIANPC